MIINRFFLSLHPFLKFKLSEKYKVMYAIIDISGEQLKVQKDQTILVNHIDGKEGEQIDIDNVLFIENNGNIKIGDPVLKGASVSAKILQQTKGKKVNIFKRKRRKGYKVFNGHRQMLTELQIENILESGASKAKKTETKSTVEKKEKETPATPKTEKEQATAGQTTTQKKAETKAEASKPQEKAQTKPQTAQKKTADTAKSENQKTTAKEKTGSAAKKTETKDTSVSGTTPKTEAKKTSTNQSESKKTETKQAAPKKTATKSTTNKTENKTNKSSESNTTNNPSDDAEKK